MICFNSVPVDNGLVPCGMVLQRETVDNCTLHPQNYPSRKNSAPLVFSALYTTSTDTSATTLFFFNRSRN